MGSRVEGLGCTPTPLPERLENCQGRRSPCCPCEGGTPVKEVKAPYMDLVDHSSLPVNPVPETHSPPASREKDSSTAAVTGGAARDVPVEGGDAS